MFELEGIMKKKGGGKNIRHFIFPSLKLQKCKTGKKKASHC